MFKRIGGPRRSLFKKDERFQESAAFSPPTRSLLGASLLHISPDGRRRLRAGDLLRARAGDPEEGITGDPEAPSGGPVAGSREDRAPAPPLHAEIVRLRRSRWPHQDSEGRRILTFLRLPRRLHRELAEEPRLRDRIRSPRHGEFLGAIYN